VVLLNKTTNTRIFYFTLSSKVDALKTDEADAYVTPIDLSSFTFGDLSPHFRIRLHDRIGQVIEWQFVPSQMVRHASPEVLSRADNSGVSFFYAPHHAAAANFIDNRGQRAHSGTMPIHGYVRDILCDERYVFIAINVSHYSRQHALDFLRPRASAPMHQTGDKTTVTFTIAENEDASIASDMLEVRRVLDTEHLV
jgi:hypothetical protein